MDALNSSSSAFNHTLRFIANSGGGASLIAKKILTETSLVPLTNSIFCQKFAQEIAERYPIQPKSPSPMRKQQISFSDACREEVYSITACQQIFECDVITDIFKALIKQVPKWDTIATLSLTCKRFAREAYSEKIINFFLSQAPVDRLELTRIKAYRLLEYLSSSEISLRVNDFVCSDDFFSNDSPFSDEAPEVTSAVAGRGSLVDCNLKDYDLINYSYKKFAYRDDEELPSFIKDIPISQLLANSPNIRKLKLTNSQGLSDSFFANLSHHCKKLHSLTIKRIAQLDTFSFMAMTCMSEGLKKLSVELTPSSNCEIFPATIDIANQAFSKDGFDLFIQTATLEKLSIKYGNLNDHSLALLSDKANKLSKLKLWYPGNITPNAMRILSSFNQLDYFEVNSASFPIDDDMLKMMATSWPKLMHLALGNTERVTQQGLQNLAKCEHLKDLEFDGLNVDEQSLEIIFNVSALKNLSLGKNCHIELDINQLVKLICKSLLPKLKKICLESAKGELEIGTLVQLAADYPNLLLCLPETAVNKKTLATLKSRYPAFKIVPLLCTEL